MTRKNIFLTVIILILFALYLPINRPYGEIYSFYSQVDNYIPLLTIFVIPYISYYFFLIFSYIYLYKHKDTKVLEQTLVALNITVLTAYIFYFLFQNEMIRPVISNNNIFDHIYTWINAQVAPYNAFPSLHVAVTTVCLFGFKLMKTPHFNWLLLWGILIILSTVFTKQHFFLDILGGLVLAIISFKLAEYINKSNGKNN